MPRVPQYNQQVREAPLPSVRQQATADPNAYGALTARAVSGLGQDMSQVQDMMFKRQLEIKQQEDTKAVLDISAKFDTDVIDFFHHPEKGLFAQKMDNAKGSYERANQFFAEKAKEYDSLAVNDTQKQSVRQFLAGRQQSYLKSSSVHEAEQFQLSRQASTDAAIAGSKQGVIVNYANPEGMNTFLTSIKQARLAGSFGKPQDVVNQEVMADQSDALKSAAVAAIREGNLDSATTIAAKYSDLLHPSAKAEIAEVIRVKREKDQEKKAADNAKNMAKTLWQNSGGNITKALEALKGLPKTTNIDFNTWQSNVIQDESGGNYDAESPAGAKGKYQIMPDTWREWAPKAGLTADAPMTPENQERVGQHMLRYYYDKYGPYAGAVAFYAGEQNGQRAKDGKTTLIGDNGQEYSIYAKQGEFPSVHDYATSKLRGGTDANEETEKALFAIAATERQRSDFTESETGRQLENKLAQLPTSALLEDKIKLIENSGLEPRTIAKLTSSLIAGRKSEDAATAQLERLAANEALALQDVENLYAKGLLSHDDYLKYRNKAYSLRAGTHNKEEAVIDRQWHDYLKSKVSDSKKHDQLQNDITALLKSKNGQERLSEAYKLVDQASKDSKGILFYSRDNNLERQSLLGIYDKKLIDLSEQGFSTDQYKKEWGQSYGMISRFLANIGEMIKGGDTAADAALKYLLDNNYAINPTSFNSAYTRHGGRNMPQDPFGISNDKPSSAIYAPVANVDLILP